MNKIGPVNDLLGAHSELNDAVTALVPKIAKISADKKLPFDVLVSAPPQQELPEEDRGVYVECRPKNISKLDQYIRIWVTVDGVYHSCDDDVEVPLYVIQHANIFQWLPVVGNLIKVNFPYRTVLPDIHYLFRGLSSLKVVDGVGGVDGLKSLRHVTHSLTLEHKDFVIFRKRAEDENFVEEGFEEALQVCESELADVEVRLDSLDEKRSEMASAALGQTELVNSRAYASSFMGERSRVGASLSELNRRIGSFPANTERAKLRAKYNRLRQRLDTLEAIDPAALLSAIDTSVASSREQLRAVYGGLQRELSRYVEAYPVLSQLEIVDDDRIKITTRTGSLTIDSDGGVVVEGVVRSKAAESARQKKGILGIKIK